MDKQMIEEMAKRIVSINNNDYMYDNDGHKRLNFADADKIAEELLKYYQPKIPEGAVVLTEKEYKRFERIEKIIKLAKMERANGYEVKNGKLYYFTNMLEGFEYEFKDLQEICDAANHYNEEFFGLQQRIDFWKDKAETTAKETAEKFAEMANERIAQRQGERDGYEAFTIDDKAKYDGDIVSLALFEICKDISEGKV